ncbi:MAG TPA: glycosyltransferase family 9 protein [Bacteroidota bacterium]|nr:glycosyltransferase family 9 protein [Bacteroidota bacterium]
MALTLRNFPSKLRHAASIELQAARNILTHGFPDVMLQFLGGIGDELLLTAVAHELKKRTPSLKIWQVSHSEPLLFNNPDYQRTFNFDDWQLRYAFLLKRQRVQLSYSVEVIPAELEIPPDEHIIARLCRKAGVRGDVALRPYIVLTDEEKKRGKIADRFIVVQNVGQSTHETFMNNKKWYPERMQEVVNILREKYPGQSIVLLGGSSDIGLDNVVDLRGKTTVRESAAVLANAECFIGTSGFLKHLARAVDVRSVIIYGGREHSHQTGYICNENLDSFVECSPCWRWNTCDYDKKCMQMISVQNVVGAFERLLEKRNRPLEVETLTIQ